MRCARRALLEQRAKDVAIRTVEAELDGGYGIFARREACNGRRCVFAPEAAQWVAHEQWHPEQEQVLGEDGSLTSRVPYADATELAMDVLRHGEQVRVVAPDSLAQLVSSG